MGPQPRLILASASPRRLDLLRQVGIVPDAVMPADIDETPLKDELPRLHALRIAGAKAETLRIRLESEGAGDALILAADTVVACGRRILPKAESEADVRRCLALLSGRRHVVHTAVVAIRPGQPPRIRQVATRVSMKRLSRAETEAYIACGEGLGKAGGYAIQGRAACFIPAINGSYSGVVGLPLAETISLITGLGFVVSPANMTFG